MKKLYLTKQILLNFRLVGVFFIGAMLFNSSFAQSPIEALMKPNLEHDAKPITCDVLVLFNSDEYKTLSITGANDLVVNLKPVSEQAGVYRGAAQVDKTDSSGLYKLNLMAEYEESRSTWDINKDEPRVSIQGSLFWQAEEAKSMELLGSFRRHSDWRIRKDPPQSLIARKEGKSRYEVNYVNLTNSWSYDESACLAESFLGQSGSITDVLPEMQSFYDLPKRCFDPLKSLNQPVQYSVRCYLE